MHGSALAAVAAALTTLLLLFAGCACACNDAVCGSIVSKCTLLQSCNCTIEEGSGECSCCQRCHSCLEPLYTECCSCFEGFCPPRNVTLPTQDSTVFDLEDRLPELWDALLEGEDERWNKVVFPVELHPSLVVNQKLLQASDKAKEGDEQDTVQIPTSSDLVTVNCTVAFHEQCMSKDKCMQNCRTMGATSGRWFGESGGCCECIGHNCRNYGLKEPRCLGCIEEADGGGSSGGAGLDDLSVAELEQMSDAELEQYYNSFMDDAESRGEDEL